MGPANSKANKPLALRLVDRGEKFDNFLPDKCDYLARCRIIIGNQFLPAQLANIESITAVVIGGISLFGGRGSILGMLFGALIVGVFTLGLRLLGADAQWTYLLIGVLIIGAVAIDQWIRKVTV